MMNVAGKVAFVTGGVSGIGLGMAQAFAEAGMKVVVTGLRADHLKDAEATLKEIGPQVLTLRLDVTDRQAYAEVADRVEASLGPVDLLCNNAGVGMFGPLTSVTYADWDWILGVNIGGVVNGIQTFLPRMLARGKGGHILTTASAAGLFASPNAGIYTTSKMAVVGFMECLRGELRDKGVGVSVLCPHLVRTNVYAHGQLRPQEFGAAEAPDENFRAMLEAGMDPLEVGRRALQGILRNDLYILTHSEIGPTIRERFEALQRALPDDVPDAARLEAEAPTLHYWIYGSN
jgi:NAD(P)-dependent dehydrogenase (short-subunit alcohol dehydrogenase family)